MVLLKPVLKKTPGGIGGTRVTLGTPLVNRRAYAWHQGGSAGTPLSRDGIRW